MDKKRNGSRFWGFAFLLALFIMGSLSVAAVAGELIAPGEFSLDAWNQDEENYIKLEWDDRGTDVFYSIYRSEDEMVNWETVSGGYSKDIKVLNVYPNVAGSDSLQAWMKAQGGGKIEVTKMPISEFNEKHVNCMKDENNLYIYDVIAFGFWDGNNGIDILDDARIAMEDYINSGYGVLFGHDTLLQNKPNFAYLGIKYVNLDIETPPAIPVLGNTKIQSINNGFLLNNPWQIEYGVEFEVPMSHSFGQIAYGTIWMNYTKPFTYQHVYAGDEMIRGTGSNNFYLTTNGNTALIQTGHSNGESTESEQRVLANVLTYLARHTDENWAEDRSAEDLAAPEIPAGAWGTDVSQITISSVDYGTPYWYKIESVKKHNVNDVETSDIVKEICITGLKGFYLIEDKNDYLDFDETAGDFYLADSSGEINYTMTDIRNYIHVKAVDHAGNVSDTARLSPRDLDWSFTVEKEVDEVSGTDEDFVFRIDYRPDAGSSVQDTFYGVVTVPAGDTLATINFQHLLPGYYTITEKDTNWTYQLDASTLKVQQIELINSAVPKGFAGYKNNVIETSWIYQKGRLDNKMKTLEDEDS